MSYVNIAAHPWTASQVRRYVPIHDLERAYHEMLDAANSGNFPFFNTRSGLIASADEICEYGMALGTCFRRFSSYMAPVRSHELVVHEYVTTIGMNQLTLSSFNSGSAFHSGSGFHSGNAFKDPKLLAIEREKKETGEKLEIMRFEAALKESRKEIKELERKARDAEVATKQG